MRNETQGLTLREIIEHMLDRSGLVDFYRTEKEGADRIENLEELVNAAEAFVTQEGFGKDAVACRWTNWARAPSPRRVARAPARRWT
jgi:DNA helicase-2/ATP-dependent DNA helicase PcrA